MRGRLRKSMIAAMALLIVAGTTVAVPNSASARWGGGWHGGGWHGGGWRGGGWGWAVSALALEPACSSLLLLVLLTTAATATTTHTTMATGLLTAMALMGTGTVAPTMVIVATTRAIGTQVITPIVVITIDMVAPIRIVGTPTVENSAA